MKEIKTGTNTATYYFSEGRWKDKWIQVTGFNRESLYCRHELEVMHHYGDKGEHYCPTMFLICPKCGGIAEEPEPYECKRWGI